MIYLNPYDLVEVIGLSEIDSTKIKRIKRRVFSELELLDNEIEIKNRIYSRSEVVELFDIIEKDSNPLEYYHLIFQNSKLNDFLYDLGDKVYLLGLNDDLKLENEGFIQFISPFLVEKISKIYRSAFLCNEVDIVKIEFPLEERYLEKIYAPIYQILQEKITELYSLKESEKFVLNDVKSLVGSIELINSLPDYFINIRNELAFAIRNLAIDAFNEQENISLSFNLINNALQVQVDTNSKDKLLSDKNGLEDIRKNIENQIIEELETIGKKLNSAHILSHDTVIYVKQLITKIDKNDRVAKLLQYISLILWDDTKDIDISLEFTKMALDKVFSPVLKNKIQNEKKELQQLDLTTWKEPSHRLTPSLNVSTDDSLISGFFGFFLKLFIIYIILVLFITISDFIDGKDTSSKSSTNHTNSYQGSPTDFTMPSDNTINLPVTNSDSYDWSQELGRSNQINIDSTLNLEVTDALSYSELKWCIKKQQELKELSLELQNLSTNLDKTNQKEIDNYNSKVSKYNSDTKVLDTKCIDKKYNQSDYNQIISEGI